MTLAADLHEFGAATAFLDRATGERTTYAQLEHLVASRAEHLAAVAARRGDVRRAVVVHEVEDDLAAIVSVLAGARSDVPVMLARPGTWAQSRDTLSSQLGSLGFDGVVHADELVAQPRASSRPPGARLLLQSGGTTGAPRPVAVDLSDVTLAGMQGLFRRTGWRSERTQLLTLPMHHAAGLVPAVLGVADGHRLVSTGRPFDPALFLDTVRAERVEWFCLTPTHMRRLATADAFSQTAQWTTVQGMVHTAAPCDEQTKRRWIETLGPDRVHEFYSSTEQAGLTLVSGSAWLERPGTVGRGYLTRVSVRRQDGSVAEPREIGEVFMRSLAHARRTHAVTTSAADGYLSVGDHGYLDEDGYLFLRGRDGDMFTVGGENVYPAEIEDVILSHPGVADVVVRPRSHDLMGSIAEAIVVPAAGQTPKAQEIRQHCRSRLAPPARPYVVTFVDHLPRTDAGKLTRRSDH